MRSLRQAVWRRRRAAMVARDSRLMVFLTAALIWALLGVVRPSIHADAGLVGEYFENVNWNGQPAFTVVDAEPSTATMRERWNNAPPEQFSVRWTGFLTVGRSGMLVIAIAPTVMWMVCKKTWGLQSDLAANPWAGAVRLSARLVDGVTPQYLFYFLTVRANAIWLTAGLVILGVMISLYQRHRLHPGALIALTTAVLYFTGIAAVYLSTPHDILPFYLLTSATRTMATASVALFISMFFLLAGLEAHAAD